MEEIYIEMFYLNSTLNFEIPPALVFQLELLTALTAQQKEQLLDGIQIKHLFVVNIS